MISSVEIQRVCLWGVRFDSIDLLFDFGSRSIQFIVDQVWAHVILYLDVVFDLWSI